MSACFKGNVALKKHAVQLSTHIESVAGLAVDGNLATQSCTGDHVRDEHPWWAVDLGAAYDVGHVILTSGNCRPKRNYASDPQ